MASSTSAATTSGTELHPGDVHLFTGGRDALRHASLPANPLCCSGRFFQHNSHSTCPLLWPAIHRRIRLLTRMPVHSGARILSPQGNSALNSWYPCGIAGQSKRGSS